MYDAISEDYDRFVNWQGRLAIELPFMIEKLHEAGDKIVLDAATGTGMHAIALAQCGFTTAGADISRGMVERARSNAKSAGIQVRFEQTGFGSLAQTFGEHSIDALLCLGNSLPHVLSNADLSAALVDFIACLRPGGLLLLQNRNYDPLVSEQDRWMEPQAHREGGSEWLFFRFYDFDPDGLITFNMVTLKRIGLGNWSQNVTSSRLRPLLRDELVSNLATVGFIDILTYGNMAGALFDAGTSPNLVIVARSA